MTSNNEETTDQAAPPEQPEKFDVPTAMTGLIAHVEAWKGAREIVQKEVETINILRAQLKEAGYAIALDEFDQGNRTPDSVAVVQSITPELTAPEPEPEPDEDIDIEIIAPISEKAANQQTEQIRKEAMGPAAKTEPIPLLAVETVTSGLDRAMKVGFANADKEAAANVIGPPGFGF